MSLLSRTEPNFVLVPTWSTAVDRAGGVAWWLHHNTGARSLFFHDRRQVEEINSAMKSYVRNWRGHLGLHSEVRLEARLGSRTGVQLGGYPGLEEGRNAPMRTVFVAGATVGSNGVTGGFALRVWVKGAD